MAIQLLALTDQIAELQDQKRQLEQNLAAEMSAKRLQVSGVGVFERHKKSARKTWDHDGVFSTLLRQHEPRRYADAGTSELLESDPFLEGFNLLRECMSPSWRVTALRNHDIDPDEFAETTYDGTWSISFTGSNYLERSLEAQR